MINLGTEKVMIWKGNNVYTLNNGNGKIMRYSNTNKLYLETEIIYGEIQFKRFSLLGKVGEIDFVNKKRKVITLMKI